MFLPELVWKMKVPPYQSCECGLNFIGKWYHRGSCLICTVLTNVLLSDHFVVSLVVLILFILHAGLSDTWWIHSSWWAPRNKQKGAHITIFFPFFMYLQYVRSKLVWLSVSHILIVICGLLCHLCSFSSCFSPISLLLSLFLPLIWRGQLWHQPWSHSYRLIPGYCDP